MLGRVGALRFGMFSPINGGGGGGGCNSVPSGMESWTLCGLSSVSFSSEITFDAVRSIFNPWFWPP